MLVGVGGAPGTGKTTISTFLERETGFIGLHRDDLISHLFRPTRYNSREQKDITFQTMLLVAGYHLREGRDVVLDLSFSTRYTIASCEGLARECGTAFRFIHCTCPDELARRRIRDDEHVATDRTEELHREVVQRFEPVTVPCLTLDTSRDKQENLRKVLFYISEKNSIGGIA